MIKQLTPHGNSWALIIDKPILELLKIDPETTKLELSTDDGQKLVVKPILNTAEPQAFEQALAKVNRKHARTLRRLAK